MNFLSFRRSLALPLLLLFGATAMACAASDSESDAGPMASAPPDETPLDDAANRAIAEADIVQMAGGRLYAMSRSGSVSVVDISTPGRLSLLGQVRIAGEPFEMYRRGDQLVAMTNGAFSNDGKAVPVPAWMGYQARSPNAGAGVVVIDVFDPTHPWVVDTFPVPGEIADSRVVGDILYLATYENGHCWQCTTSARTFLTSFDLVDLSYLRPVDRLGFASGPSSGYDTFTSRPWKRSIVVTQERMYIGGLADSWNPSYPYDTTDGVLEVVDVRDPKGRLVRGATIPIQGPVLSRWQVDERDGILRVVSQRGAGVTRNGVGMPAVQTFKVESSDAFTPLGSTKIQLPEQEGLRAVRFDKDRAYAITFKTTDPLFVIDLSDPAKPKQRGELHMPGFVFHMEPRGDKLLGLGVDPSDPSGNLNVSLFDVRDLDRPSMVQRVSFGPLRSQLSSLTTEALAEDQDRIQKAFRVIGDGTSTDLVVVPFSAPANWYGGKDACTSASGGVQLVDWNSKSALPLTKRALLPLRGHPRRALANGPELVTVSESNVRTFSLANRNEAVQTADLEIDACMATRGESHHSGLYGCSMTPSRTDRGWGYGGIAMLMGFWFLRRRRAD